MNGIGRMMTAAVAGLAFAGVACGDDPEPTVPAEAPALRPMPFEAARERTFAWASAAAPGAEFPEAVRRIWENAESGLPARGVQDLVVRSFAAVDPRSAELFKTFDPLNPPLAAPDIAAVSDAPGDEFFRANVTAHVGRLMTDARMYDEALAAFDRTEPGLLADPATALFYRAVCEHQLLMKDQGLKTLAALEKAEAVPDSYASVARLMKADLEALEPESLGEVAGLMRDVERRLELARGGQRVQKKGDEIAEKLDEMIKNIEQQMNQSSSSGGGSNGGRNNQSDNPSDESVVKGQTAPGEVDPKKVDRQGGWGDLPPREREQAKNEIEKAFPSNYGRLISEYFLKRTRVERPDGESP